MQGSSRIKDLHHANLLITSPESAEEYVRKLCQELGLSLTNNPDFFLFPMKIFGVKEARRLRLFAGRKSVTVTKQGEVGKKIFLITPATLTQEAQNALLKTFEEPFPNTHFFLAVREEGLIITTLRSRMKVIEVLGVTTPLKKEAEGFISLSLKKRLLFAKKFVDDEKSLPAFLDELLLVLRDQDKEETLINKVYNMRRIVGDGLLAPRLVLEHLALVL